MSPTFFQTDDLESFQRILQMSAEHKRRFRADYEQQLKNNIFNKTLYWVEQVSSRLPTNLYSYVAELRWYKGFNLSYYSWGRFYLVDYPDRGYYITLGVDSGETKRTRELVAQGLIPDGPALIIKVDIHGPGENSPLSIDQRAAGQDEFQNLPFDTRWRRIGVGELATYDWSRLINESVAFVIQHEEVLRRLWNASGYRSAPQLSAARLGEGERNLINEGRTPAVFPAREIELNDEHRRLSNLLQQLLTSYDYKQIKRSRSINYNGNKARNEVDMTAENANGHTVFFEIKALSSVDSCIREALGQLLEYAYWQSEISLASHLIIATAHPLSADARHYLQLLRANFQLPIGYVHIDALTNQLFFEVNE